MKLRQRLFTGRRGAPLRGQATVELALAVTFLFFLLIGIADVARIFTEQQAIVHAAGVGARWMTVDPNGKSCSGYGTTVDAIVREDIGNSVPQTNILSIVATTPTPPSAQMVSVRVTYRHSYLFGLISNVPSVFTGQATMPGTDTGPGTCPTSPTATRTPYYTPGPSPTRTITLTPTVTDTPSNTPTFTLTPTNTATPTWTNTPTNTSTSTVTRTPTATPTIVCPYQVTVDGYKNQGFNPLGVKVTVLDAIGRPMQGLTVTIVGPGGATTPGTTDVTGYVCISAGSFSGNTVTFNYTVSGGPCSDVTGSQNSRNTPPGFTCP